MYNDNNTVRVTSKIAKNGYKNKLQKFYIDPSSKRKRHRSIDRQEWEHTVSFAFVDFSIIRSKHKTSKVNKSVINYLTNTSYTMTTVSLPHATCGQGIIKQSRNCQYSLIKACYECTYM